MEFLSNSEHYVALLTSHQRRLAGFVRAMVPIRADAEEVLQDVNVYLWRHATEFQPGTDFAAWAMRIAHFHVLTWRKRQSRNRLVFDDVLLDRLAISLESERPNADRRQAALDGCLQTLNDRDRELITKLYCDPEATPRSVAQQVGRSAKGIYASLNRIRLRLLECIERALVAEGRVP